MKTRRPQLLTLIAVLALLGGCQPSELRLAPAAPVGGGSTTYTAPAGSGSVPASPLAPVKPLPMMENPDAANISEEVEEVWADSEAEAQKKCNYLAQGRTSKDALVTVTGRPQKLNQKGSKWVCRFRVEVTKP
jgi:hypothetical protein